MIDCRLQIKKKIAESIINESVTRNVITKINDYTLGVNYSKDFKNSKTRDQAYTIAQRLIDKINTQYAAKKYGDVVTIDDTKLNLQIKIKPNDKLLDFYELRAFQKNNNLDNQEAKQLTLKIQTEQAYQLNNQGTIPPNPNLDKYIQTFLNKLNVNVQSIKVDFDYVSESQIVQGLIGSVITIVEGKADVSTLTEEATHFMIALMRGTPLYDSMMSDVSRRYSDEYNKVVAEYSTIYQNDDFKLKEETITKIITKIIVNKAQGEFNEDQIQRLNSWWNKIVRWIQQKLGIVKLDPYTLTAYNILTANIKNLNKENIKESSKVYQLNNKAKEIRDKILDINNQVEIKEIGGKRKYVTKDGKILKESVTEFRDRLNKKQPIQRTERIDFLQKLGTEGHKDWENILARVIEERNGDVVTQQVMNLPKKAYDTLEVYAINLINSYPQGTEFLSEVRVIDEKANKGEGRGGTIDFMAILPDGTIDILDWKFINFKKEGNKVIEDEAAWYKRNDFQTQLDEYKRILREIYNFEKFGKLRVIPINVDITNWSKELYENIPYILDKLEIGNLTYNNTKTYLNAIPNMSEKTGEPSIDNIINGLQTLYNQVESEKTGGDDLKKEVKAKRLERIRLAIKQLQISQELDEFIRDANFELEPLNNITELSDEEILDKLKLITFYQQINLVPFLKDESSEENKIFNNIIKTFSLKLNGYEEQLSTEADRRLAKIAESNQIDNINNPQIDIGWWQRWVRTLSQQSLPKLKLLYQLVTKSKDRTIDQVNKLNIEIKEAVKRISDFQADKGIKKENYFNFMLKVNSKGNRRLIDKYSSKTYDKIKTLKQNIREGNNEIRSRKELMEFFDFDKEAYNLAVQDEKLYWQELYKNDLDSNKKTQYRVDKFIDKFSPTKQGLLQPQNRFLKLKEDQSLYSSEYNYIQQNEDLKNFYDLFTKFLKDSKKWLDVEVDNNFIPQVPVSYIEQITDGGFISISKMKDIFLDSITAKRDSSGLGQINQLTGEIEYEIPIYYTSDIGGIASKDLGKILSVWANMAYNNKNMQEIENSVKLTYEALKKEKQVKTDLSGTPIKNADGIIETSIGKSNTLEAFIDYMNDSLYGIKMKDKDKIITKTEKYIDEEGKEQTRKIPYSSHKILNKVLTYFSAKTLGLNTISGLANALGGITNGIVEGANGRFYNKKDFIRGAYDVAQGIVDVKNKTLLRYFDIMGDMEVQNRADSLSVKAAERFFTYDKIYILQKGTDSLVYNTILSAMLHSHTLNEQGKIVKKTKDEKSLYDISELKDDKLFIKGLTNLEDNIEYKKFRRKVLEVGKEILGMSPSYDIRLVNNTIIGKITMQFRNWIPRMVDARFAEISYNQNLETYEEGRYRAFAQFLFSKQFPAAVGELLSLTGFINKDNLLFKARFEDRMKQIWDKLPLEKKQELNNDFNKFLELKKQNLQATMFEVQMIASFMLLILVVKPFGDDDDKDLAATKYLAKVANRALSELTFFVNPASTSQILRSPVPIMGMTNDLMHLVTNTGGEIKGYILDDKKIRKKNKPTKYLFKTFPFTSEIVRNIEIINNNAFE